MINVTITGVDERTPLLPLCELLDDYPQLEVAFLYSVKRAGREPRYPTLRQIVATLEKLGDGDVRQLALHLCGKTARTWSESSPRSEGGFIDTGILDSVGRVQINGAVEIDEVRRIAEAFYLPVITQHNEINEHLLNEHVEHENHHVLVDDSGGRGIRPAQWDTFSKTDKRVGFAGGLGPDILETELPRILGVAKPGDWIDMESGVRTDDWLDLSKVRRVLEICQGSRCEA